MGAPLKGISGDVAKPWLLVGAPPRVKSGGAVNIRVGWCFPAEAGLIHGNPMIRDTLKAAQVAAMKGGDKPRLAAIRLILAKLKDRDIELRTASALPDDDVLVVEVLQKMAKQRRESILLYRQGGREELAEVEEAELAVIDEFLPQQMGEAETSAAIQAIKAELGASSVKDMGKVMAELKARHGQTLDMSKASALVKAALA